MRLLPLAYRCRREWSELRAAGRDRHCDGCASRVYDLSQRTEIEAAALLHLFARGGLCVRFVAGPDGAPRFRTALRPASRKRATLAAAALGVAATAGCGASSAPAQHPVVVAARGDPEASDAGDHNGNGDSDGDGVPDAKDLCPAAPEDRDGFSDGDGCPDPDNDQDRVGDAVDRCPNEPETFNGVDDDDGCPDRPLGVVVGDAALAITQQLEFARSSARLMASSFPLLDELARLIVGHAELRAIDVQGHASADEGNAHARQQLAMARARAVVEALVARGVERARLNAVGVGSVAGDAGRRVEFVITQQGDGCSAPP